MAARRVVVGWVLLGAVAGAARGQAAPETPVDPYAEWRSALTGAVEEAKGAAKTKAANPTAARAIEALKAIAPSLREQQQVLVPDWQAEIYARFGDTDHALAAVRPGRESAMVVRLLLLSLENQFATKNMAGVKDIARRLEELFTHSRGTPSAGGLFETSMKIRARMGDAGGATAVATLGKAAGLDDRQITALRVSAIRVMLAEGHFDAATKVALELQETMARFDAYAALGVTAEQAGNAKEAASHYVTALAALNAYMHAPLGPGDMGRTLPVTAVPAHIVAVGVFRCSADTRFAERFVVELDPLHIVETKQAMLEAAGDPATRLRVAAAFRDVLLTGEESLKLGRKEDAAKLLQAWLAGETVIQKQSEVVGAAAENYTVSPTGMPGRIASLMRGGKALGEAGGRAEARTALGRAGDALEIIKPRYLRPDWVAEVAAAQAGAGLADESTASFAEALQWAGEITDATTKAEMTARVALAQVLAGDLEGAGKTAATLPGDVTAKSIAEVYPALAAALVRKGKRDEAEAMYKRATEKVAPGLRLSAVAAMVRAKASTGDIAGAAAALVENPGAPVSNETIAVLTATLVKTGKVEVAKRTLTAGLAAHSPELAERLKMTVMRLKDARQFAAAIGAMELSPTDVPPDFMAGIYMAAVEAGQGATILELAKGDDLSTGERAAAMALARKGELASAKAIIAKLVEAHKMEDYGIRYPALVADGMVLASLGDKAGAVKLGQESFKKAVSLWVDTETPWKDAWLPETLSRSTMLRVAAEDYETLTADVNKIHVSVRQDLAGVMATALLNQSGPLAGIR